LRLGFEAGGAWRHTGGAANDAHSPSGHKHTRADHHAHAKHGDVKGSLHASRVTQRGEGDPRWCMGDSSRWRRIAVHRENHFPRLSKQARELAATCPITTADTAPESASSTRQSRASAHPRTPPACADETCASQSDWASASSHGRTPERCGSP
jgi:hypothetical protein